MAYILLSEELLDLSYNYLVVGEDEEFCAIVMQCLDKIAYALDLRLTSESISRHESSCLFVSFLVIFKTTHVVIEVCCLVSGLIETHHSLKGGHGVWIIFSFTTSTHV